MKFHWGHGIAFLYAAFAGLILLMVYRSAQDRVDLVSSDYYEKEIRYEETIQKSKRAADLRLEWTVNDRIVKITFPADVSGGKLKLYRPSNSEMDFEIPLTSGAGRQQIVSFANKPSGIWKAIVDWSSGGQTYYEEKRLYFE